MKCKNCHWYGRECAVPPDDTACQDYKKAEAKIRGRVVASEEYYRARQEGRRTDLVAGNYIVYC